MRSATVDAVEDADAGGEATPAQLFHRGLRLVLQAADRDIPRLEKRRIFPSSSLEIGIPRRRGF